MGPEGEGYDIQPAVQGQGIFLGERLFDEGLALRLSMLIAESNEFTKSEKEDLIKAIYKDQSRYAEGAARPAINEAISQSPAAGMARSAILRSMTERIKDSIPVLAKLKEKNGAITLLPLRWVFASGLSVEALVRDEDKGGVKFKAFAINDFEWAKEANADEEDYKILSEAFNEKIRKNRWEIDAPAGEAKEGPLPVPYVDKDGGLFLSYHPESLDEKDRDEALVLLARHASFAKDTEADKVLFAIEWAYAGEDENDCRRRRKMLRADQPFLGAILVYCSWLVRQDGTSPETARKALSLAWREAASLETIGNDGWSRLVSSLSWHLLLHRDRDFNDLAFPDGLNYIGRTNLLNFITDITEWEKLADRAEQIVSLRWLRPLLYVYLENFVDEKGFDEARLWRLLRTTSPLPDYIEEASSMPSSS